MGAKTKIQWSDATWGPTRGCSMAKGSEAGGCLNCYAARYALRGLQKDSTGKPFAIMRDSGPRWTGIVELAEEMLYRPLTWKKPKKIFVNSMSDLFHEDLPDEAIDRVFAVMALCPHHTFQVLTKRPARMLKWATRKFLAGDVQVFANDIRERLKLNWPAVLKGQQFGVNGRLLCSEELIEIIDCDPWPLPNVHLGVSIENPQTQLARVPLLQQTPAAVRFVSQEPQLEFIDWTPEMLTGISQVIVGGESGPGARPFDIAWPRRTIAQCRAASVKCFVKQMGADPREGNAFGNCRNVDCTHPDCGYVKLNLHDKKGGDPLEWAPDLRVREFVS